jgi:hypothetical protein
LQLLWAAVAGEENAGHCFWEGEGIHTDEVGLFVEPLADICLYEFEVACYELSSLIPQRLHL